MQPLDYGIVVAYLVGLVAVGLALTRKAGRSGDDYFLAGRRTPWWALGASGMSSNLDAAGTITIITLLYLHGLQGFFIEMRGGVVLPIAVFLAFMGKWHMRSRVMTTGEWMLLRFGSGYQGRLARYVAAATYLVITVGMVVFFLAAAGKFLAVFLPFSVTTCAVAMAVIALAYTMASGLYGVVWTDVFQAGLIGFAAVYMSVLAFGYVTPELLADWPGAASNQVWPVFFGGLETPVVQGLDAAAPALGEEAGSRILYSPFIVFLIFWAGKGLLEGLGGSGGSAYMAQRFYAAKDGPTVQKLCMLWTVLFAFRWPMVLGFVILAIHLGIGSEDPEAILPQVLLSDLIPVGMTGVLVAAIFAASMSTFDSTINAGASYVVRDLWVPLRGEGSAKSQVYVGYAASILIVAAGLVLALALGGAVVDVWVTIVIQLFPAFLLPFALRWFWARFNGAGFAAGVATGFAASLGLELLKAPLAAAMPADFGVLSQHGELTDVFVIAFVTLGSAVGCLAGTYLFPATDEREARAFYEQVRPLGTWPSSWKADDRDEHRTDVVRLVVAVLWQVFTFLLPMALILHQWWESGVLAVLWIAGGLWLLRDLRRAEADDRLAVGP
ncbi:sodium:solute symporter family transporter [Phycisphaera mikurensis]|uniref:Putative sodium/solute symporter n=1 Tax=Phycisphaera mikurensis (strain NBRC 102666 / KCTC 22515 / FYK2301M01) TaxID=1142394 RepID=I0IGD4_PHYMF|nr:putative sodium/solute symporter [Phycisphaera mikurensis]MBB6440300.1 Na+/proline symporter [Phycisphaera mikurensis]BAM04322.1 putative sodium/solute symporter [Phycisphaera mikurensis NBRC 102666]